MLVLGWYHVGILLPSGVEFIETLFAVAMVGGVSVLMNARYRAPEVAYVTENADLVAIVTNSESDAFVDFVARLTEAFPELAPTPENPLAALCGFWSRRGLTGM